MDSFRKLFLTLLQERYSDGYLWGYKLYSHVENASMTAFNFI